VSQKDRRMHNEHTYQDDSRWSKKWSTRDGEVQQEQIDRFRSGFEADYCWSNNNDRDDGCARVRSGVYIHDTRVCAETMTACDDF